MIYELVVKFLDFLPLSGFFLGAFCFAMFFTIVKLIKLFRDIV